MGSDLCDKHTSWSLADDGCPACAAESWHRSSDNWEKNCDQRDVEIEELTAKLDVLAPAMLASETEVKRLEAEGAAATSAAETAIAKVERLEADNATNIADLDAKLKELVDAAKAEGMKAAAGIPKPQYPAHEPDAGYVKEENSWLCKQHSEDERDMELLREDKAMLTAQNDELSAAIRTLRGDGQRLIQKEHSGEAGSRERTAPAAAESSGSASPVAGDTA